jgi:cell division protein FtsB
MTENKEKLDLTFIIEQHKKEIWAYKQKESEWEQTKNLLEGNKQIINDLSQKHIEEKARYKTEMDRLLEENGNIRTLYSSLEKELDEVKKDNKRLADQVSTYTQQVKGTFIEDVIKKL